VEEKGRRRLAGRVAHSKEEMMKMIHLLYVVICPHNHNPANFIRHVVEIIIDFGLSTRKKNGLSLQVPREAKRW
jgi:hypothetical protein